MPSTSSSALSVSRPRIDRCLGSRTGAGGTAGGGGTTVAAGPVGIPAVRDGSYGYGYGYGSYDWYGAGSYGGWYGGGGGYGGAVGCGAGGRPSRRSSRLRTRSTTPATTTSSRNTSPPSPRVSTQARIRAAMMRRAAWAMSPVRRPDPRPSSDSTGEAASSSAGR